MLRFLHSTSRDSQSDEALLRAYRAGADLQVLAHLYERYIELLYGVCLKYLKNETDAEDAVMSIFEQLAEKARTHEVQNFRSWLYVLAKNYCLMQLRKAGKEISLPDFVQLDGILHPEEENLEEQEAQLRECMEQLPFQQRRSVELFYFNEKSYQEIAAVVGEELGKIRSYIQNGRRNLRLCMEKKKEVTK